MAAAALLLQARRANVEHVVGHATSKQPLRWLFICEHANACAAVMHIHTHTAVACILFALSGVCAEAVTT
jgi:hypothetical protein